MTIHRHAKSGYAVSTDGPWVNGASEEEWPSGGRLVGPPGRRPSMTDEQFQLWLEGAREGLSRRDGQMPLLVERNGQ